MPSIRIGDFDLWRPGYGGAAVTVFLAGTSTPASIFSDEDLSVALDNPLTLSTLSSDGISYGKWPHAGSVYVGVAIELSIASTDQTGIIRPPLTTLVAQDASDATVRRSSGGTVDTALEDVLARLVHAKDFGAIGVSSATNTATLTAAIGAASAMSGGRVILPAGTIPFSTLTLPAGVVLEGQGRGVTILQSEELEEVITLSGDRAGLAHLTLDGVDLGVGSVGVFSKANDETVLEDVLIKRFETGLHCKGGRRAAWRDLYIDDCATGAKLHGDDDAGNGADGDEFRNNEWRSGKVSICSTIGVDLSYEDEPCFENTIADVGFEDNTGTALRVNGARHTSFDGCWFSGNTANLSVLDDDASTDAARRENTVVGLRFQGGSMVGGTASFANTCQDVVFERMRISDVDFTLAASVVENLLFIDCTEDSLVTVAGSGATQFMRRWTTDEGEVSGVTTNATTTKAWAIALDPGQACYLVARVHGRQRNAAANAVYHIVAKFRRPGSTLGYDTQTANFTAGNIVTGATSGATARIQADSDSGATGTLTLIDIDGTFIDNELITDTGGGSATVNGTLTSQNAAILGAVASVGTDYEDDSNWACTFAANGTEVELRVTGAASKTVEWTGRVDIVRT